MWESFPYFFPACFFGNVLFVVVSRFGDPGVGCAPDSGEGSRGVLQTHGLLIVEGRKLGNGLFNHKRTNGGFCSQSLCI